MPLEPSFHALSIRDLVLWVRLGCSEEERREPQEVRVAVEFRFHEAPGGELSDRLVDTICYARVSRAVQESCETREFYLIEKLAYEIYQIARRAAELAPPVQIAVSLHKVRPPVPGLTGGAHYRCGDFIW